jgi:hypothetical protein
MLSILYSKFYLTHDETKMHNYIYIHTAIYINIMYIVVVFLEKGRGGPSFARSCRLLPFVIIIGQVFEWFVIHGFGQFVEFGFSRNENISHAPVLESSLLPACQRW